jgi:hypothetical protein
MNTTYTFIALDIARERSKAAAEARRAEAIVADGRPGFVRRGLASALALVSRGSTAAVRRLDECVADDLDQALAVGR